ELVGPGADVPLGERHAALEIGQRRAVSHGASRQRGAGGTPSPSVCARTRRAPERFTPGGPGLSPSAGRRRPLSRGVSPARSWGLRDSGEDLLLRRPAHEKRCWPGTLPHGFGDCTPHSSPTTWNWLTARPR